MRSLFLIAILFTLVTIAVKEPNQSAWDVVEEWKSRISATANSGSYPDSGKPKKITPPANISMDYENLKSSLNDALDKVAPNLSSEIKKAVSGKETKVAQATQPEISSLPTQTFRADKPRIMPKSTLKNVPKLPATPVKPVEAVALNDQTRTTDVPFGKTRHTRGPKPAVNYAEIRGYYESANRLLNEIK